MHAATRRAYLALYSALSNPAYSLAHRQSAANILKREYPEFANTVHRALLDSMQDYIPPHMDERLVKCKTIADVLAL